MANALFSEREQAFEAKFSHDNELDFLTKTRGGAMFAKWVSSVLGHDFDHAQRYTQDLVRMIVNGGDLAAAISRVHNDMIAVGHELPRQTLEQRMADCQQVAHDDLYYPH